MELTKVSSLDCIAPELEDSECDKTNGLNLYTRRDSIVVGRMWWLVKMGIGKFNPRMAVIPIVEILTLCVVVTVVSFGRPGNVESAVLGLDTIVEMEMNYLWIEFIIERSRAD